MNFSLHIKGEFFAVTHHSNRDRVAGSNIERSIQHIFRLSYFGSSHLQQNVARFYSGVGRRRSLHDLGHFRSRTLYRRRRLGYIDPNPAVAGLTETDKVAADFLRRLNWHGITRRVVFETAHHNA